MPVVLTVALAGCAGGSSKPSASREAPHADSPVGGSTLEPSPVEPGPAATVSPAAEAAPEPLPGPPGTNPPWWIDTPRRDGGRLHVTARADADTMVDARRLAIRAGTESLKDELKGEPGDVKTEKADLTRLDDGKWRVFVLMSCKD
jgi:hypothetical protein